MEKLQERAIAAAARFCERKGFRIIETGWASPMGGTADIIADDGGTICFVDVTVREASERGFEDRHMPRHDWETLAMSWLMGSDIEGDAGVRFDTCELLISGTKAMLKFHANVLSES